ncbi:MAG: hypothetical protein AAB721_01550 [Patescibacteria group bacterium]
MATLGDQEYSHARAFNLYGSTALRFWADPAAGTLKAELSEGLNRAWTFPNKSGTFGISGTFTVNVPAIAAFSVHSTNVTVVGVRTEDGIVAAIQNTFATIGTTSWAVRGIAALVGCQAANGGVHMTFANFADTATVYKDVIIAYTAVR